MDEHAVQIRRLMLSITRMDGAYYYFARTLGYKENLLFLLYALGDGRPHSQAEICRDWLIPKTTVNTNVKELVAGGYITLAQGDGTREKMMTLTDSGRAYAEKLLGRVYQAEQAALEQTLAQFSSGFVDAMEYFAQCLCREFERRTSCVSPGGSEKEKVCI